MGPRVADAFVVTIRLAALSLGVWVYLYRLSAILVAVERRGEDEGFVNVT